MRCTLLACHVHATARGWPGSFVQTLRAVALRQFTAFFLRAPASVLCLPEGVQIGPRAFGQCIGLAAVRVPASATMAHSSFAGCSGLSAERLAELAARYEDSNSASW